jgi:hypothetical protein
MPLAGTPQRRPFQFGEHDETFAPSCCSLATSTPASYSRRTSYSDIAGLERLLKWSGNPQMALATIKDVVPNAAQYGRDIRQAQSWSCSAMPS